MTESFLEELIQKYAEGTASEEEIQQLKDWYRFSIDLIEWPSNDLSEKQQVYHRMLDRLKNDMAHKRTRIISFAWSKVAALLILFLCIAALLNYLKPFSANYISIANPSGKIQMVLLPDSSEVWMNASSTIRYPKKFQQKRELELEGEAYFKITHDPQHPFIVKTGELHTIVLGTSFNVKAYRSGQTTSIAVSSGKVKVNNDTKELGVLTSSTSLQFHRQLRTVKIATIDTNAVSAWRKGRLQFDGETFGDIASVLESWYGIKIILASTGINNCRYYMTFENTISLDKLLTTLSSLTEMQYTIDEKTKVVTISGIGCR